MENDILDDQFTSTPALRRRELLPTWIKVITWLFLIMGGLVLLTVPFIFMGSSFDLSIYGLQTYIPLSPLGILIMLIFIFKGVVAFGLWTEKEWAVRIAIIDAYIGIAICIIVMFLLPNLGSTDGFNFDLRFELILLAPYLQKMLGIKSEWIRRSA